MVLPANWDKRTIKGTRMDFFGNAGIGKLIFEPSAPRVKENTTKAVIFAKPTEVSLLPDGTFIIDLPVSSGDTDITPYFAYKVTEQLQGAADYSYTISIDLSLPTEGPGYPFDISDLMVIGPLPQGTTALTKAQADLLYQPLGTTGGGGGGPVGIGDVTGLEAALADRVTGSELDTALLNYVPTSAMGTYVTGSQLTTALEGYVTGGQLATTLGGYVQTSALSVYATDVELASALTAYQPKGGVVADQSEIPPGAAVGSLWVIV